jgi:hypothetical protein
MVNFYPLVLTFRPVFISFSSSFLCLRLGALAACGWRLGTWSFGRPVITRPVLPMPRYRTKHTGFVACYVTAKVILIYVKKRSFLYRVICLFY